mmetsp:Transcript_21480/g.18306  ORF Transcript_21480/g.18306 Transcript_21480/m.18306 type:complete len:85 (+) Transcript_21480:140-394(+)
MANQSSLILTRSALGCNLFYHNESYANDAPVIRTTDSILGAFNQSREHPSMAPLGAVFILSEVRCEPWLLHRVWLRHANIGKSK